MKKLITYCSLYFSFAFGSLYQDLENDAGLFYKITEFLTGRDHYFLSCTKKENKASIIRDFYVKVVERERLDKQPDLFRNDDGKIKKYYYNQVTIKCLFPKCSFELNLPSNNLEIGQYIDPKTITIIRYTPQFKYEFIMYPYSSSRHQEFNKELANLPNQLDDPIECKKQANAYNKAHPPHLFRLYGYH